MKTVRIAGLLGAATLVLLQQPAAACGDKLSMMGGGVSFDLVNPNRHRGNVVLFAPPGSALHASSREQALQKSLQRAGHTVRVAGTPAELATALQAGNVDIVLTDVPATATTPRKIAADTSSAADTTSLAILYRPTAADVTSASPELSCVAPIDQQRGRQMLQAIENVLASKGKVAAGTCNPVSATSTT